jgi:hypothetical protein
MRHRQTKGTILLQNCGNLTRLIGVMTKPTLLVYSAPAASDQGNQRMSRRGPEVP